MEDLTKNYLTGLLTFAAAILTAENPRAILPGAHYEGHNANTHPQGNGVSKKPDLSGGLAQQPLCKR